jgi:pimeloyl-ACP methyl ester carboxylesterase
VTILLTVAAGLAVVIAGLVLFAAYTTRRAEALVPPLGTFVEVMGARIHYVEKGAGPVTLLMIHGLGGQARNFTYALAERLAGHFRLVIVERPGAGYSTRAPGSSAAPRAQAEVVAAVIRTLGLDRPLLVGHSLGGTVALATAVTHPELVSGLALICPFTQEQEQPPPVFAPLEIRSALLRRIIAWTVAVPVAILKRREVLGVIFGPDAVPRDYPIRGGGLLSARPRAFVSASTDLVAVRDDMPGLVERYGTLRIPVRVIFGTGDRILDYRVHGLGLRAQITDVEVELIAGGHMIPLTAPEPVAAFVRAAAARCDVVEARER